MILWQIYSENCTKFQQNSPEFYRRYCKKNILFFSRTHCS